MFFRLSPNLENHFLVQCWAESKFGKLRSGPMSGKSEFGKSRSSPMLSESKFGKLRSGLMSGKSEFGKSRSNPMLGRVQILENHI